MAKYKVLFTIEMDESGKKILRDHDCEVIVAPHQDVKEYVKIIEEEQVDAIMTRVDPITPEMMAASKKLKVVAKHGAGLDNIDREYARDHGIQVVFAPAGNANAVAEHCVMMMLLCATRFRYVDLQMRGGNFNVRYTLHNTYELEGKTLGLIGCGRISQLFATKAVNGFGMKAIAYDPFLKQEQVKAPVTLVDSRDDLLKTSDFVSIHLPSLPSTKDTMNIDEFRKMKDTAFFINCARGALVKEEDLVAALNEREIAGAGLDVFKQEPLPINHPFLVRSDIVLTPHTAATTEEAVINCCSTAAQGIADVLEGREPEWPANLK